MIYNMTNWRYAFASILNKNYYLFGGGTGYLEFVTNNLTDEKSTNGVLSLDLGGGMLLKDGQVDIRCVYQLMLGSKNLDGQAALSVGYKF